MTTLTAPVAFAGLVVCAAEGCGAILSVYNDDEDGLCAPCRRRVDEEHERGLGGVDLDFLVMSLLCGQHALHPGEPLDVVRALAAQGIEADSWQVQKAVRHMARRHGLIARGAQGRPGYAIVEVERRYRPFTAAVGFGDRRRRVVMERDPASGRYAPARARACEVQSYCGARDTPSYS